MPTPRHAPVLIVDFGSQVTQLIARRLRESGVYCEIHPWDKAEAAQVQLQPAAIILSGGPASAGETASPIAAQSLFDAGVPMLGICYGEMTMCAQLGGVVEQGHNAEFGRAEIHKVSETPLLDGLDDPDRWVATAPLLVSARGLVESAGTVFAPGGSLPVPLLAGLFEADARRLLAAHGGALTVPAANGRVLAVRAVDYAAVHGYDPLYVDGPDDADLCLRLGQLRGTAVGVVPGSVVRTTPLRRQRQSAGGVPDARLFNARWRGLLAAGKVAGSVDPAELWADAGFDLIGFVADDDPGVPADAAHVRPLVRWRAERPGTAPSLRWTVDISALADVPESLAAVRGAAAQLARALADCGQVAAVRRPGTPVWPSEHDDVVVSVGGRVAARPVPAAVNVLWLPEVAFVAAAQEAIGFDLVLAADPVAAVSLVRRVADAASRLAGRPGAAAPAVVVLDSPLVGFGDSAAAIDELVGRVLEIAARRAPGPGRA